MPGGARKHRSRPVKVKKQKKKYIRSKDPLQAVLMWGVQHSINEITTSIEPSLLLPDDFKAFSKIRVENQYYNKENLPGHFKFKEYCPCVFHDLRKRFNYDDIHYMNSLVTNPLTPTDSPGRSGAKFFLSHDKRLVIKSLSSEEVALLHLILPQYHAHVVTHEGKTLLPHYLGMYRLTVNNAETYWIVMRSVFSCSLRMHLKFDLKGSTVDRSASVKDKQAKGIPTLKDNDFIKMDGMIAIGQEARDTFISKLEGDVEFLQKMNLMDYSLLVGIHDCLAPISESEDDDEDWEDGNGYVSDDLIDGPHSPPSSPTIEQQPIDQAESSSPVAAELGTDEDPPSHETSSPVLVMEKSNEQSAQTRKQQSHDSGENSLDGGRESQEESAADRDVDDADKDELETSGGATTATVVMAKPAVVTGERAVEEAISHGFYPVVDHGFDTFAIPGVGERPQIYYLGIIDVLTNYGARKRAAHAAKTMKHGAGAEISTVRPEQYARRFVDFLLKHIK